MTRPTTTARYVLVVTRGPDAGAHVTLGDVPRIVGRARDVDLGVTDIRVSRRHLEVTAEPGGVRVRLCAGAAPFLLDGRDTKDALLAVGGQVVVGDTVLSVTRETPAAEPARAA